MVEFSVDRDQVTVSLELEEHPQGRLCPYLMAPMTMAAVDRSLFTSLGPVEFAFLLNGETAATVAADIK